MTPFNPTDTSLFFKREDPKDRRLGELVKPLDASKVKPNDLVIAGYPDDEGIKNSGGRIGASLAPTEIRKHFYKMTPPVEFPVNTERPNLWDFGNLDIREPLAQRHQASEDAALKNLYTHAKYITLGGGHDYGFPDGSAFLKYAKDTSKHKPLVINFDAHLDVRPMERGITSGTPFYRLLKAYPGEFDFIEIGLQSQCNARSHWDWALAQGATLISLTDLTETGTSPAIALNQRIEDLIIQRRTTYLSVDIDVFSQAHAPGCSQSFPYGMDPRDFMPIFHWLASRLDIKLLGIYEVSPPLDIDGRTSKLAAQILHKFLALS